jgi:hypothetical protein
MVSAEGCRGPVVPAGSETNLGELTPLAVLHDKEIQLMDQAAITARHPVASAHRLDDLIVANHWVLYRHVPGLNRQSLSGSSHLNFTQPPARMTWLPT